MNLENQVASLELCKRLKELNVKQESSFYYVGGYIVSEETEYFYIHSLGKLFTGRCSSCTEIIPFDKDDVYSAFTSAELGEILPKEIDSDNKFYPYELTCKWELHYSDNKMWHITYRKYNDNETLDFIIYDENEANARALMLIHLIDNKLMEIPK